MAKRKNPQATDSSVIHRRMPIAEIVTLIPEAKSVLAEYGLHCFSCAGSEYETLGEGCLGHGFSDEDIDELVDDLNTMLRDLPPRPETLTVTEAAARAIQNVAKAEQQEGVLEVIADAAGGFCMEFPPATHNPLRQGSGQAPPETKVFGHHAVPEVRVAASPLTLKRIGGAIIDFREGRFKLDLPEDSLKTCCGGSSKACDCNHKHDQNAK